MSKEIKKPIPQKESPSKVVNKEVPNQRVEETRTYSNVEKGESRKPVMATPIPPPDKKDSK